MQTVIQIVLLVFGVIFFIGVIGEKDEKKKPALLCGLLVSFAMLYIFIKL